MDDIRKAADSCAKAIFGEHAERVLGGNLTWEEQRMTKKQQLDDLIWVKRELGRIRDDDSLLFSIRDLGRTHGWTTHRLRIAYRAFMSTWVLLDSPPRDDGITFASLGALRAELQAEHQRLAATRDENDAGQRFVLLSCRTGLAIEEANGGTFRARANHRKRR